MIYFKIIFLQIKFYFLFLRFATKPATPRTAPLRPIPATGAITRPALAPVLTAVFLTSGVLAGSAFFL